MKKVGRNDPCPCGSGKKYKKCCLGKDTGSVKGSGSNITKDIQGLWRDESYPMNQYYATMDEYYNEIRASGRVPYIIYEQTEDDEENGHMHIIEVGELCKHGQPCSGSATFSETDDGRWEAIESGFGMDAPCLLCEGVKDGIEICCPKCKVRLPEFTEEEILEIYNNGIGPLDLKCSECGSNYLTFKEDK